MSLVLNVEILGEFKKLTQATKGAQGDLNTMGKSAQKISAGIGKAFAAIGIGLSFKVIANELQEATKAAIEDRKSQELLALAMINTGKATDASVKAAERAISKMQISANIADDQLRPAYSKLFIATGDVTKSNELLQIALDASAAEGKSLETVTQAMAKSLAGNDTALTKLIPSLRGSKDPINDLANAFKGAAERAGDLDPYQRMQIIFGEIQEKLGTALLPVLDRFAAWMMSPPGQKALQEIADAASNVLTELTNTANWAIANKNWLLPLGAAAAMFAGTAKAIGLITTAIGAAKVAQELFNASANRNPYIIALGAAAGVAAMMTAINSPSVTAESEKIIKSKDPMIMNPNQVGRGPGYVPPVNPGRPATGGSVNITVNTPKITAQEITNLVNTAQKNGYTGQITFPRS
jgi:hypothetical protein